MSFVFRVKICRGLFLQKSGSQHVCLGFGSKIYEIVDTRLSHTYSHFIIWSIHFLGHTQIKGTIPTLVGLMSGLNFLSLCKFLLGCDWLLMSSCLILYFHFIFDLKLSHLVHLLRCCNPYLCWFTSKLYSKPTDYGIDSQ